MLSVLKWVIFFALFLPSTSKITQLFVPKSNNVIVANDNTNRQILRDYSVADKKELFADSTDYYYNDPDRHCQLFCRD